MDTDSTGGAAAVQLDAIPDTAAAGRSPSVAAYVVGVVSAVLLAAGAAVPVVNGVARGFHSVPLLVVLAVAPMAVVAVLALKGRHQTAAGVLAAVAALAPGRLVLDLILLTDPVQAARPELFRLHSLADPGTAPGLWLLLAGHVAAIAAGVMATRAAAPKADTQWTPRASAAAEAAAARAAGDPTPSGSTPSGPSTDRAADAAPSSARTAGGDAPSGAAAAPPSGTAADDAVGAPAGGTDDLAAGGEAEERAGNADGKSGALPARTSRTECSVAIGDAGTDDSAAGPPTTAGEAAASASGSGRTAASADVSDQPSAPGAGSDETPASADTFGRASAPGGGSDRASAAGAGSGRASASGDGSDRTAAAGGSDQTSASGGGSGRVSAPAADSGRAPGVSPGRAATRATPADASGQPPASEGAWPEAAEVSRGGLIFGMFAAVVAAVGVMMAPFTSTDAFLPAGSAFESPGLVLAGSLLLAFALPVATVLLAGSGTAVARGGLLGLGVTAAVVGLPNLVSGLSLPGVRLAAGPILVLAGAAGMIAAAFLPTATTPDAAQDDEAGEITLPGIRRLRIVTGVLAVLTSAAAIAGALTPQVVITETLNGPQSPSRSALLVAGLLVGLLGLVMFTAGPAAYARPALSVAWVTVPLAGTAVLTMAVTATELGAGLAPGPGVLWTALAIVGSAITACCSVVAGMVERDETTDPATAFGDGPALPGADLLTPLVAAGILAIGAFGTPSILAPDYVEPALWSSFGTPSWGLLVALLTVLGACVLAPRCRPARAAALLAGAACVAGLRAAELPLVGDEIAGAHAGLGWWLALGCSLALVIAAVLAARGSIHTPKPRSGSIR
ncbi:hypothetical protein [Amycolatopsis methanolica]|uniref:Uncharacterized protein n=1 Tax=Amycolatopsis methanolica 239 TaxID=1068978 RepID=A0A076MSU1_AMYME|nr:hypothetical protein [Amycolatopsis methanolica]AIJ20857.1 hypothetical protein AMETH_0765 [Amycolatopsis methanolica 239]